VLTPECPASGQGLVTCTVSARPWLQNPQRPDACMPCHAHASAWHPTRRAPCLHCAALHPPQTLLGEGATVVLEGQRVLPARTQAAGFSYKYSELSEALRNILR
jgi:hypothetical protein